MYRLVVIDDEYIVVEGIKAMIARKKLNYEVVGCAYDGIHGLEVVQKEKPDLVITDIRIPGLDGLSLIEEARESCTDTVFVVISGYTEFEYARRALRLGVKGYIDKPISIEKLTDVLDMVEKECFQAKEENSQLERKRIGQENIKNLFDQSVRAMTKGSGNVGDFQKYATEAVETILEVYPNVEDFNREVVKYLCVLCDILSESMKQVQRDSLFSYQEMERKTTVEEIQEYARKVIVDLSRYMEADKTGSSHAVILEILAYLEEHYQEDIGLNELAEKVGMSTAYLSVLFKNEVGTSYVKYLTNMRITQAKKLLKDGHKVNEVSEMVGYSNYRYFSDIFKKHVGLTPNEYKHNY